MNIYKLSQDLDNDYDTYDSVIVIAENAADAIKIHPSKFVTHITDDNWMGTYSGGESKGKEYLIDGYGWVNYRDIDKIKVALIGEAHNSQKKGIVLASFNAG